MSKWLSPLTYREWIVGGMVFSYITCGGVFVMGAVLASQGSVYTPIFLTVLSFVKFYIGMKYYGKLLEIISND